jgi:hypothetical protein
VADLLRVLASVLRVSCQGCVLRSFPAGVPRSSVLPLFGCFIRFPLSPVPRFLRPVSLSLSLSLSVRSPSPRHFLRAAGDVTSECGLFKRGGRRSEAQ